MRIVVDDELLLLNDDEAIPNDSFEISDERYDLGLSGIVLNDEMLIKEKIIDAIIKGKSQKVFKGNYVFWLNDKPNKKVYVANDLLSKKSIYFYSKDNLILVNTSFFDLCDDLRWKKRLPELNFKAIEHFCNDNCFCDDMTYELNTHFLKAYSYIVIDYSQNKIEIIQLPIPKIITEKSLTFVEAVETLEEKFSEGCELQWNKNVKYKTDQILSISGGMDSRAVLLHYLNKKSIEDIKTYTYAQSGSRDNRIAEKTTKRLNINNTFIPIDNCTFAFQRDDLAKANEGQMYYLGSTGAILMAKLAISKDKPGIVHTGLGGGEIMGDVCLRDGDSSFTVDGITINQLRNLNDIRRCLNFQKTTSSYFSAFSPFLYEDFFEYALSLPANMRMHRKIYIRWYKTKMNSDFPDLKSHSLFAKLINRIKVKTYRFLKLKNPDDMNPISFWYQSKPDLRSYINSTWEQDCDVLSDHTDLLRLLKEKYNIDVVHKFAVLTVAWSVKRMFGLEK